MISHGSDKPACRFNLLFASSALKIRAYIWSMMFVPALQEWSSRKGGSLGMVIAKEIYSNLRSRVYWIECKR